MTPSRSKAIALFLFVAALNATATEEPVFTSISLTPPTIKVGSPCLFKVKMAAAPLSLEGKWQGRDLIFFSAGQRHVWYGLAGVDVEAKPAAYTLKLDATMPDGQVLHATREIQVLPAAYKTVRLQVPERFVQPGPEALAQIEHDKELKQKALSRQTKEPEWSGNFHAPINSTVSEAFGTRRTLNGKLATIHRGLDYHAKEGTPILAANSGTVVLAQPLYYEGNCVIIDHGQQFFTLYMHLSRMDVSEGEKVKEGQQIGLSGATGRVTGPHLHVAVRWQGAYLDPGELWKLPLPTLTHVAGSE